jgi:hypothetical protein
MNSLVFNGISLTKLAPRSKWRALKAYQYIIPLINGIMFVGPPFVPFSTIPFLRHSENSYGNSDSTSISSYSQRKPKRISKLQKAALSQQLRENPKFCSILTGHLLGDGSISIHGKNGLFRLCSKDYAFVQFVWDYFHSLART